MSYFDHITSYWYVSRKVRSIEYTTLQIRYTLSQWFTMSYVDGFREMYHKIFIWTPTAQLPQLWTTFEILMIHIQLAQNCHYEGYNGPATIRRRRQKFNKKWCIEQKENVLQDVSVAERCCEVACYGALHFMLAAK